MSVIKQVQAEHHMQLLAFSRVQGIDSLRMLKRLCKHFSHKIPAGWNDQQGYIKFAMGFCDMRADKQQIELRCGANTRDELTEIIDCIDNHFLRFAKQADLSLTWNIEFS